MCSLINKQLLLTAYAYLFITEQQKAQQGSGALQLQMYTAEEKMRKEKKLCQKWEDLHKPENFWVGERLGEQKKCLAKLGELREAAGQAGYPVLKGEINQGFRLTGQTPKEKQKHQKQKHQKQRKIAPKGAFVPQSKTKAFGNFVVARDGEKFVRRALRDKINIAGDDLIQWFAEQKETRKTEVLHILAGADPYAIPQWQHEVVHRKAFAGSVSAARDYESKAGKDEKIIALLTALEKALGDDCPDKVQSETTEELHPQNRYTRRQAIAKIFDAAQDAWPNAPQEKLLEASNAVTRSDCLRGAAGGRWLKATLDKATEQVRGKF